MCKVYNEILGNWVDIGVFSTCAKAMEAGSLYISNQCTDIIPTDWDYDMNVYTDCYQGRHGWTFTRVVTETEIDRSL